MEQNMMIFEEFNSTCLFKVSKYCHYHSTPVLCSPAYCPRVKSEAAFQKRLELEAQYSKSSSYRIEDFDKRDFPRPVVHEKGFNEWLTAIDSSLFKFTKQKEIDDLVIKKLKEKNSKH
ncbi:MAG: hypothetical protein ACFFFH_02550 [Candidatus Thorarchaeota archaeon]